MILSLPKPVRTFVLYSSTKTIYENENLTLACPNTGIGDDVVDKAFNFTLDLDYGAVPFVVI